VLNALDLMENKDFLEPLKFGIGDGKTRPALPRTCHNLTRNFTPDLSQLNPDFTPDLSQLNPNFIPDLSQLNPDFTPDLTQLNPNFTPGP
jgi:hypothetical protein